MQPLSSNSVILLARALLAKFIVRVIHFIQATQAMMMEYRCSELGHRRDSCSERDPTEQHTKGRAWRDHGVHLSDQLDRYSLIAAVKSEIDLLKNLNVRTILTEVLNVCVKIY